MIDGTLRPKLASKARLRFDRHSGRHMLVYPERGMALNATAHAVVELCEGQHRVEEIVELLAARFDATPRARIEREVHELLQSLIERGLIEVCS